MCLVQIQIQFYHIDSRFAQQAESPAFGVPGNKFPHFVHIQPADSGHAGDLVFGGGRADMRIQAAGRRRDQIDGNGSLLSGSASLNAGIRSRTALIKSGFVGPRFDPLDDPAL